MNTNRKRFITAAVAACLGTACNGEIELGRNDSPVNVGGAGGGGGGAAQTAGGAAGQLAGGSAGLPTEGSPCAIAASAGAAAGSAGAADASPDAGARDEVQLPFSDPECQRAVLSMGDATRSWGHVCGWLESLGGLEFSSAGIAWTTEKITAGLAWWSLGGWYYSTDLVNPPQTLVAHAVGYTRVSDIGDAHTLDYSSETVGKFPVGEIVVFQHADSGSFLALRAQRFYDQLDPSCFSHQVGDFEFYLQTDGSGDFSSFGNVAP